MVAGYNSMLIHRQVKRSAMLQAFYRSRLKERITVLLPIREDKIGVATTDWRIKRMKTRWGSCNIQAKRIWLNLELAKKASECLEYVLVHELVHLLEHHHNQRFKCYMDTFLPDWRERCDLLNRLPLAPDYWNI